MAQVIGFVGRIASGKDTAADYLRDRVGANVFRMGDLVREIADAKHEPKDRHHLHQISEHHRQQEGARALAERVADRIA